jgi:hypothetical protein
LESSEFRNVRFFKIGGNLLGPTSLEDIIGHNLSDEDILFGSKGSFTAVHVDDFPAENRITVRASCQPLRATDG